MKLYCIVSNGVDSSCHSTRWTRTKWLIGIWVSPMCKRYIDFTCTPYILPPYNGCMKAWFLSIFLSAERQLVCFSDNLPLPLVIGTCSYECISCHRITYFTYKIYRIMYVLEWRTVYALTRGLLWCLYPSCVATREINTKITLEWAHKQFVTRVHTLFYFLHDITNP